MNVTNRKTNTTLIWVSAVVAAVVIAAVVAFATSGDDAPALSDGTVVTDASGIASASISETQPVTVVGTALPPLDDPANDPAVGMQAPVLDGFHFDGTPSVIDPADGPVMLVFLAHWCPHCNREVPRLLQWKATGAVPPELRVMAVTTAAAPDRDNYPPSEWMRNIQWPADWGVLADSAQRDAAVAYGVSGFPFFVIVGSDGLVKARDSGEKEITEIQSIVAAALAG